MADHLDKIVADKRITKYTFSSLSILGSGLTIAGGVMTVLTFGTATPMLIAGLTVTGNL